ncbi:MAG: MoxR family ATPase, partial [Gammaproteobacteria bacterium]|nr:MoxR family ATPase [Gammaproteobacteria bacterium]
IQFTSDLLPADILGISIYRRDEEKFEFHPGPIFSGLVLADEVNRATPKAQSALLEAMAEGQVTIEGETHPLPKPFFVIATQNPIEFHGTYPLPEAQMDRFAMRFKLGFIEADNEVLILSEQNKQHPVETLMPCINHEEVLDLKQSLHKIRVSDELKRYIVDIIRATRNVKGVQHGASPRASLALIKTAQALAMFDGKEFISPDHIQELASTVIAHRIVLDPEAQFSGVSSEDIVTEALDNTPVPI